MAKILSLLVFAFTFLGALPQEDGITETTLENGVVVWVKESSDSSQMMSICLIWQERHHIYMKSLDAPCGDFDEVQEFLEEHSQEISSKVEKIGVVVVGEAHLDDVVEVCETVFSGRPLAPLGVVEQIMVEEEPGSSIVEMELAFPITLNHPKTVDELKLQWQMYLFQAVMQAHYEHAMPDLEGRWLHPEMSLIPRPSCAIRARCALGGEYLPLLERFLIELQIIRSKGFAIEELELVKGKMQKVLMSSFRPNPDHATLAAYLAEQLLLGSGCPEYDSFMRESISLIPKFSMGDMNKLAEREIIDNRRHVHLRGPLLFSIEEDGICVVLENTKADPFHLSSETINDERTGPSIAVSHDPYSTLLISELEAQYISDIVNSMAYDGPLELFGKRSKHEEKGRKINGVHPMRFLGTVFSNPTLKKCIKIISERSVPGLWSGFLNGSGQLKGLSGRLTEEYNRNNLFRYVKGLSAHVGASPEKVASYVQKADWEGLVIYLMEI